MIQLRNKAAGKEGRRVLNSSLHTLVLSSIHCLHITILHPPGELVGSCDLPSLTPISAPRGIHQNGTMTSRTESIASSTPKTSSVSGHAGAVAALAVSAVLLVLVAIAAMFFLCRRRRWQTRSARQPYQRQLEPNQVQIGSIPAMKCATPGHTFVQPGTGVVSSTNHSQPHPEASASHACEVPCAFSYPPRTMASLDICGPSSRSQSSAITGSSIDGMLKPLSPTSPDTSRIASADLRSGTPSSPTGQIRFV